MLRNGVPYDIESRDGKTCDEMTRNEETVVALREARDNNNASEL